MRLLMIVGLLASLYGCGDNCEVVGTREFNLIFTGGACSISQPWTRLYTIVRNSDGGFVAMGGANEMLEIGIKNCQLSVESVEVGPDELPGEAVSLTFNVDISREPYIGNGMLVVAEPRDCTQRFSVSGIEFGSPAKTK